MVLLATYQKTSEISNSNRLYYKWGFSNSGFVKGMGCGTSFNYPSSQASCSLLTDVYKERQPASKNYVDFRNEGWYDKLLKLLQGDFNYILCRKLLICTQGLNAPKQNPRQSQLQVTIFSFTVCLQGRKGSVNKYIIEKSKVKTQKKAIKLSV